MNELKKRYIKYFGVGSALPPKHIMKTLVEMRENGTYENKMEKMSLIFDRIKNEIEDATDEELTNDNIIFDINFDKEKD